MTFKVICYYLKDLVCTAAADARSVCGIARLHFYDTSCPTLQRMINVL